jgi:hypothetical protein
MACKDPVKNRARAKRWRDRHLEEVRTKQRAYYRKNPATYLLSVCKARAKKLGVPFNLTKEDIVIPEFCPVFGTRLEHGTKPFHDNSPSLDRFKPELGYVKGNIYIISFRANRIKGNATLEEIEKVIKYIQDGNGRQYQSDTASAPKN